MIVGFGLFVRKSYRELFRIINVGSLQLPSRATIAAARKRLLPEWLELLHSQVVELFATPKVRVYRVSANSLAGFCMESQLVRDRLVHIWAPPL